MTDLKLSPISISRIVMRVHPVKRFVYNQFEYKEADAVTRLTGIGMKSTTVGNRKHGHNNRLPDVRVLFVSNDERESVIDAMGKQAADLLRSHGYVVRGNGSILNVSLPE